MIRSEMILSNLLADFLSSRGFFVKKGVRMAPREIDILFLDPQTIKLVSIEVKLKNWRKAISQATMNKMYSHYSLIAMGTESIKRIPKEVTIDRGIGLIEIKKYRNSFRFQIVEHALESTEINQYFKRSIYKLFQEDIFKNEETRK